MLTQYEESAYHQNKVLIDGVTFVFVPGSYHEPRGTTWVRRNYGSLASLP